MKLAIMQPYLFPYIGYFQLMSAVDEFIVYDNIEFSKKGWINRNRILVNGKDSFITLPVKNDSDYLDVRDRFLADLWPKERRKFLNRITESYRKAPQFEIAYPVIERSILFEEMNLFKFIFNTLIEIKNYLEISTPFIVSSTVQIDHTLKGEKKVMELCVAKKASSYINPIGGVELYNKENFKSIGVDLHFLKANEIVYPQYDSDFVPFLSIVDVMMFNKKDKVKDFLKFQYSIIS